MSEDSSFTAQYHPEYNDDPPFSGVFSAILSCSNKNCDEHIVMCGYVRENQEEHYDAEHGWGWLTGRELRPKFFVPPLRLIKIPARTPKKAEQAIWSAFELLWSDPPSCANKIRVTVELLMDHFLVKKYPRSGPRKAIPLHKRIDIDFRAKKPDIADHLLACKWIGNEGSHALAGVSFKQALDGLEMLEHVLTVLFDKDPLRLVRLATKINRKKRPI